MLEKEEEKLSTKHNLSGKIDGKHYFNFLPETDDEKAFKELEEGTNKNKIKILHNTIFREWMLKGIRNERF